MQLQFVDHQFGAQVSIVEYKVWAILLCKHHFFFQFQLRSCPLEAQWPRHGWRKCVCPAAQWENLPQQLNGLKTGIYFPIMTNPDWRRQKDFMDWIKICNPSRLCQWGLCHTSDSWQPAADLIQWHSGATLSQSRGFRVLHLYCH